jgi:rsbT co-antagonist protein RsbR
MSDGKSRIPDLLSRYEAEILAEWLQEQMAAGATRDGRVREPELREQGAEFLSLLCTAAKSGNLADLERPEWSQVREMLAGVSRSRALQGFSPTETAAFVFSLKQPLFSRLRQEGGGDAGTLADETWRATTLVDSLGLYTTEIYVRTRNEVIARQQKELLELSTPVVKLWDGILALPIIGTLDSSRTQEMMENLLQRIVDTGAEFAIIDITGVPTVDTLTAQHLLKTITAARLMGAECIISGIRPQIAQTIVHLGVDLEDVTTKASLADAFALALRRTGSVVTAARARS